ncbi:MAG: hypothetical protein M1814_001861 [Vezdaea aestivalis]|nr:MAG: hypothetical protein M1814_001861 [Vezdaea aestivalis]
MTTPEPDVIIQAWYPKGVKRILACGGSNNIGLIDETTVLKYPQICPGSLVNAVGDEKVVNALASSAKFGLRVEEQIYKTLGHHDRIVGFKGQHDDGILLEYMPNGSVADYLHQFGSQTSIRQKLKWALQAAEAVAYIHRKDVIHCDISVGNVLLGKDLDAKLCDFQGRLLYSDGTTYLDGGSSEGIRTSMPREDPDMANCKTDIFALGSVIFFIITNQHPFSELKTWEDDEEIRQRFKDGCFPVLPDPQGGIVVARCWSGQYESADSVVNDLQALCVSSSFIFKYD